MTISTSQASEIFLGNGVTTSFSFTFIASAAELIEVSYMDLTGNITVLNPSQYTIFVNPAATGSLWGIGGTVTYPTVGTPIAAGTSLTVTRVRPFVQETSISNQGPFFPIVIEAALDILEMQLQQIAARTGQFRGIWATDVLYNYADIVQDGINGANTSNYYFCTLTNTSGTWSADLANGDWAFAFSPYLVPDGSGIEVIATGGTTAETLADRFGQIINVKDFGAIGNNSHDDTAAFVAAEASAYSRNIPLFIPDPSVNYVLTSDFTIRVPMIGNSNLTTKINSTRRLIVDPTNGALLKNFYFTSTMTSGVGGNSMIHSSSTGSAIDVDSITVVYPAGTVIANINKQTINFNNCNNVSIRNSRFFGGNLEIYNCSTLKVQNNFLDMQGQGNDGIKLSLIADYFIITGNHIHNTFNDGTDTFTSGAYGIIANNVYDTIGFNGIQCKTEYRFSPYTSGSSDQPTNGQSNQVIISNNVLTNVTMANAGSGDAAGIYVLFADERFRGISNAANNGSGLIRLTTSAYDSVNDPDALNFQTGNVMKVFGVRGTTEANGIWTITKINSTTLDLQSSTFTNTYIGGGYFTFARAVSGAANNGSGLIRLTVTGNGLTTGDIVIVESVGGVTAANGTWTVTVIDANTIDLQGSTFSSAYTSGGYCSLALTAQNAPCNYVITGNQLDNINSAGTSSGPTCGIYAGGASATITGNNVTNVGAGLSAASYSGSGILVGRLRSTLTPPLPTNMTITGNVSQGINVGLALVDANINFINLSNNTLGYDVKRNVKSFYGIEIGSNSIINNLSILGNLVHCSNTDVFNTSSSNILTQILMNDNQFFGTVNFTGEFNNLTFNDNIVTGVATFGSTTASLASTKFTCLGNQIITSSTSSTALAWDGITGFIVKDNQITGGRDMLAYRTDSSQGIIKDNIGSSVLAHVITGVANNGGGLCRVTSASHGFANNDIVTNTGIVGTTEANGTWLISGVTTNTFDLVGSTFSNAYVSGGNSYRVVHLLNETSPEIASVIISGNFAY